MNSKKKFILTSSESDHLSLAKSVETINIYDLKWIYYNQNIFHDKTNDTYLDS